jgi:hypothetical protein
VGQIRYKPRILRDHLVDATINWVGFLEPFLALSWAFSVPLHTREVAGSKPAAPIDESMQKDVTVSGVERRAMRVWGVAERRGAER